MITVARSVPKRPGRDHLEGTQPSSSKRGGVQSGVSDADVVAELRRVAEHRTNVRLVVVSAAMVVGTLLVVLLTLSLHRPPVRLSPGEVVLIVGISLVPAAMVGGLVAVGRARGWPWLQPVAFTGLSRPTRRQLLRAMRRGDPIPAEQVGVARDLVARLTKTRWLPGLFFSLPLLQMGNVYEGHTQRVLWTISTGLLWSSAWWQTYLRHRLRVYAQRNWNT
jgi:hypothetical protein